MNTRGGGMANKQKNVQGKTKKIPERCCVGCQGTFPKKDLLRVLRSPEGELSIDFTGKKNGRGAYLCKKLDCFKKARKSGAIKRSLDCEISEELYDDLEHEIKYCETLASEQL